MSRKRLAPARWPLPDVVNPPDSVCFQINVPNDRFHIAAFLGAIFDLAKPYKWANDDAHTAIQVGAVWFKIFEALRRDNCDVPDLDGGIVLEDMLSQQIRISPDNACIIQMWCIDHWEDWYNPESCIASGVTQPGGDGPIPDGETKCYTVTLQANQKWLLPAPVSGGFVVTVEDVDGAWNDGSLAWYCPTGQLFTLGICGASGGTVTGDPTYAVNHMRLIAGIDSSAPQYVDGYNSTFVVPSGLTDVDLWFQANDSSLADNSGSLSFKVCVKGAAVPTGLTSFDFTASDGGWAVRAGYAATYSAGVGFVAGCDNPGSDFYLQSIIEKTVVSGSHITKVVVTFDRVYAGFNDGASGGYAVKNFTPGGGGVAIGSSGSMATGSPLVDTFDANPVDVVPSDYLTIAEVAGYLHNRGNCASLAGGSVTITGLDVYWTGADPF